METQKTPRQEPSEGQEVSLGRAFGGRSALRDLFEVIALTLIIFFVVNALTGRFQVLGSSMQPTLHSGQYVIVSKLVYHFREPQRGDVVVFEPPNGAHDDYIKRIIGLPGEHIEVRGGAVWVDGYRLEEPYVSSPMAYSGSWDLGPDEYFVLGDNRADSSDSRAWGPLHRDLLVGKAWLCYWPPQYWGLIRHYRFPELTPQE